MAEYIDRKATIKCIESALKALERKMMAEHDFEGLHAFIIHQGGARAAIAAMETMPTVDIANAARTPEETDE